MCADKWQERRNKFRNYVGEHKSTLIALTAYVIAFVCWPDLFHVLLHVAATASYDVQTVRALHLHLCTRTMRYKF